MELDDGDGVAQELEILETAAVVACGRGSMVDRAIVTDFVSHQRLQSSASAASAHSRKSSDDPLKKNDPHCGT